MSDVSLLFNFLKGRDTANPALNETGNNALKMGAKFKSASVVHQAAMLTIGAGIAGAVAEAIAFTDATLPMLTALAATPALGFAAAASLTALVIGFKGLGGALKQTTGEAMSAADAIISAEHRVAQAQRGSVQAQIDLNLAREDAVRQLRDIAAQLNRAHLDEKEAALSVRDAELALTQARRSGNQLQIMHAELGLADAKQSLVEVQNRLADTQVDYTRIQAKGVEGSDQVKQALQRQADATYELAAAQRAQKQASMGSASGQAYAKLADAGKQVVDALRSMAPAWRDVHKATQQAELAGVGGDLRQLGGAYLPMLRTQLSAVASGWNTAFRQTLQLATTKDFVRDTNTTLGNTAKFAREAGKSMAPMVDGMRQFGTVGSAYLPRLGFWMHRLASDFDAWATRSRNSGAINKWIENGIDRAKTFGRILRDWGGAVKGIFAAGNGGPAFLDTLEKGSKAFRDWTNSANGKSRLSDFFGNLRAIASDLWTIFKGLASAFVDSGPTISLVENAFSLLGIVSSILASNMGLVNAALRLAIPLYVIYRTYTMNLRLAKLGLIAAEKLGIITQRQLNVAMKDNPIGAIITVIMLLIGVFTLLWNKSAGFRDFWKGLWKGIHDTIKGVVDFIVGAWKSVTDIFDNPGKHLKGAWDTLLNSIKGPFKAFVNNVIIDPVNAVIHTARGIIDALNWINPFPDIPLPPTIPHLAKGGVFQTAGFALVGEAGPEVIAGPKGTTVTPLSRSGRSGGDVRIHITSAGNKLDEALLWVLRKAIDQRGGNVQAVLGRG